MHNNRHSMKFYIIIVLALVVSFGTLNAQIDRSQPPKAGPAPEINIEKPETFKLDNGLTVMVVENHKLPRVAFTLRIDNKPFSTGKKAGIESILGNMMGNGTTSISKDEFNEEIDFLGASLNFSASSASARSLSKYSERMIELMADAAINPLLTEEEFETQKKIVLEGFKAGEKSVDAISSRVGPALSFGKNHPYGEFETEETINNVTFGDVVAHYETYFNPNNAYLVVIGDVEFDSLKDQIENHFSSWKKSVDVQSTVPNPTENVRFTQINFVNVPDATQADLSITNNVELQMKDDDYHAALIANDILGGGGEGYLFKNLREEHGYTYGAYSGIGSSRYGASRFQAVAKVRNEVADSAVVETLKELNRIRTESVNPQSLEDAKAKYTGNFVMRLERPETIANYALDIELNDLPDDFYANYLKNINDVSVEDVKRVANKYIQPENARIIIVGNGSETLEALEKSGIPIKYFDKYANPVDKPSFSKEVPSGVTAKSVVDDYISKIGGKAKLESVNSIMTLADVTIQGMPFQPKAVMKQMAPNKMSLEMNIEGMGTVMKQKFNGTTGYREQQGVKADMSETEIAIQQQQEGLFPELYLTPENMELVSVATIVDTDAYKIEVTKGDKTSHRYYAVDTGLLIRTEETNEVQGQSMTTITDTADYKEVEGIMLPSVMKVSAGPQIVTFTTSETKVNEGVSEEDFN